jgi:uracil-DNA glycosylase
MKNLPAPSPVGTICETNPENTDHDSPIWLIGDSPSAKHQHKNLEPLDRRHPSRHTVWTPILDVVQRHLFVEHGCRLDDSKLFIRNAVIHPGHKLKISREIEAEIAELGGLLERHKPFLVLCFGRFAFECARRAQGEEKLSPQKWTIETLSQEFGERILKVRLDSVTLLPLLHQSIALQFSKCNTNFSGGGGNYFEYTGREIAKVLIANRPHLSLDKLWL